MASARTAEADVMVSALMSTAIDGDPDTYEEAMASDEKTAMEGGYPGGMHFHHRTSLGVQLYRKNLQQANRIEMGL